MPCGAFGSQNVLRTAITAAAGALSSSQRIARRSAGVTKKRRGSSWRTRSRAPAAPSSRKPISTAVWSPGPARRQASSSATPIATSKDAGR